MFLLGVLRELRGSNLRLFRMSRWETAVALAETPRFVLRGHGLVVVRANFVNPEFSDFFVNFAFFVVQIPIDLA
jgi:hypothetical protein